MNNKEKCSECKECKYPSVDPKNIYPTLDDWYAEGEKRFGKNKMKWKFKCPMCGHVAAVEDFQKAGAEDPNSSYTECLGRYTGKGNPSESDGSGCNWCSFGLFGIPKGGAVIESEGSHIFECGG